MLEYKNTPKLSPKISPWIGKILQNRQNLNKLIQDYGSPINIYHPATFTYNYNAFKSILEKFGISYQIILPHDDTGYNELLHLCSNIQIGASSYSISILKKCEKKVIDKDQIFILAADKCYETLAYAVQNKYRIIINSYEEGNKLQSICNELNKKAKIGLQITSYLYRGKKNGNNIGFSVQELLDDEVLLSLNTKWTQLIFGGFHLQINALRVQQSAEALRQTLVIANLFISQNIPVQYIDIGSSIPVNYIKSKRQYNHFIKKLKNSLQNQYGNQFFIDNTQINSEFIAPSFNSIPWYHKYEKEYFLENLLIQPFSKNELIYQALRSKGIIFMAQPAEVLLNQTCISLVKVKSIKYCPLNGYLINLDLAENQLKFLESDYLLDPLLVSHKATKDKTPTSVPAFMLYSQNEKANLIIKRKVSLPCKPQINDMICLINTRGSEKPNNNLIPLSSKKPYNIFINSINKNGNFELLAS